MSDYGGSVEKQRKRFSTMLIRVARELEAINYLGEAPVSLVHLAICKLPPKPISLRTVARDLDALEAAGMLQKREAVAWVKRGKYRFKTRVFLYAMATPAALRDRLEMLKGLTPTQKKLLTEGKPIAN